jgi:uncharacterized protein (DUF58 family)
VNSAESSLGRERCDYTCRDVSSGLTVGKRRNTEMEILMQQSAEVISFAPRTTARHAGIPLDLILIKAQVRVVNHITNAGVEGMDPILIVIEDEFGDLVHTQGDLSFLMPSAPVLRQWFANQLHTQIQGEYDKRQLAVWQEVLRDGEQFQVAPNLNAAILPFLAEEERFTVTVFIPCTTN